MLMLVAVALFIFACCVAAFTVFASSAMSRSTLSPDLDESPMEWDAPLGHGEEQRPAGALSQ